MRGTPLRVLSLAVLVAFMLSLSSCGLFEKDYRGEEVVEVLPTDTELARALSGMLPMLSVNSPIIPTFRGSVEAMERCRDSVLYFMLMESYSKYTGNIKALDAAIEAYPRMQITNLIPAREFEETVYTSFGGSKKITNESGQLFVYLDKVNAYTAVTILEYEPAAAEIISLERTENTYRMRVRNTVGDITSPEYLVIFVIRDDGTVYFYSVEEK